jgi:hypothetical protein
MLEIEKLPAEVQDAIATRLLAEVADEQAWAARFAATTDEQWDRLAAMAADPDIQRELSLIDAEFAVTELDGLTDE